MKLIGSAVFVCGAGGLGCPALQYLAGAGVGKIVVADADVVQTSNLHRQVLFTIENIGTNKAVAACDRLKLMNPGIKLEAIPENVSEENIARLIQDVDLVIDATDNFETRFLLGDFTAKINIPLVFAAIYGFEGQLTVFNYNGGPSFCDLFSSKPNANAIPNCSVNGVIGFVPGIMGVLQAAEAIKIFTGIGSVLSGNLLVIDLLSYTQKQLAITKFKNEIKSKSENMVGEINISDLKEKLDSVFLLDVREPYEFNNYNMGGTLIPLRDLPDRLSEIPADKDIVVVCESGVRSMHAAQYLSGIYTNIKVFNLKGGLKVLK
jgi:adenylyltransferase/sulfurtransferase